MVRQEATAGPDGVQRSATFTACGAHRLLLERSWAERPRLGFVMLNPSTADAVRDDPTIRRCMGFARAWGFGGLLVANLFTLRTPDPRVLTRAPAAAWNAPDADAALSGLAARADLVVLAWGAHRLVALRAAAATATLSHSGASLAVLGRTRDGHPRHPLYVPGATQPQDAWSGAPLRTTAPARVAIGGSQHPRRDSNPRPAE